MARKCVSDVSYSADGICYSTLTATLLSVNCSQAHGEDILVSENAESTARNLIPLLELLRPSDACREAVVQFLCLYFFGLCDNLGVLLTPTSGQCERIRDEVCQREWAFALRFASLPECGSFPIESPLFTSCPVSIGRNGSDSGMSTGQYNLYYYSYINFAVLATSGTFWDLHYGSSEISIEILRTLKGDLKFV